MPTCRAPARTASRVGSLWVGLTARSWSCQIPTPGPGTIRHHQRIMTSLLVAAVRRVLLRNARSEIGTNLAGVAAPALRFGRCETGSALGHVDEATVVTLERDGDRRGGAVAVLGEDQIGLARPR